MRYSITVIKNQSLKMKLFDYLFKLNIFFLIIFSGCRKEMTIPVYFQIDSVDFAADYITFGTASHKITDVWVTVNGVSVGVYELPAIFPVLANGQSKIQISPGIMLDGLTAKRPSYPMYTTYITSENLKLDTIYKIRPSFSYANYVKVAFIENFEDAGMRFAAKENSPSLEKTGEASEVFYYPGEINNYSGKISIADTGASFFEIVSNDAFALKNTNTQYCFLELNYKMDVPLNETLTVEVGLYINNTTGPKVQYPLIKIKQSNSWKKMYINVTEAINNQNANMKDFTIYIKGTTQKGVAASCLLDNIKLLYIPL